MLVQMGAERWAEPMEQPADRSTIAQYDVDDQVLSRWREARREYLGARAALVGQLERQGWRAPAGYLDVVFTAPPGGPDEADAVFVEVEDEHGRSVRAGEWVERDDGSWALRIHR